MKTVFKIFMLFSVVSMLALSSCQKSQADNQVEIAKQGTTIAAMAVKSTTINPFSVPNIKKALASLGRVESLDPSRTYSYYYFDPNKVTGDILKVIEADAEHHILDFPFANGDVYTDKFTSDLNANLEAIKDGNLYIVFKKGSSLESLFQYQLGATKLDELYLPQETDSELQLQAMAIAKNTDIKTLQLSLPCLFKRPFGRVQYLDQETNTMRPVPGMKVWALAFGIPMPAWTDDFGNYKIPWLFSAGTFIGTHATNLRVNVKPLDVTGGLFSQVGQVIANFIVGSNHLENWFNACRMKNDININFTDHNQKRYWAQILDAVRLNQTYCDQDGINPAPWGLTWYAVWAGRRGGFSAPMLSHIASTPIGTIGNLLSLVFDTNISVNSPNLFNLLTGLLPSITSQEAPTSNDDGHYSERLMQWSFHELAHASLFRQVGDIYWSEVITNIIAAWGSSCQGYGCGTEAFAGNTQLNESWAEYLGRVHHSRTHTNGLCETEFGWLSYPDALEKGKRHLNDWIPTGVFYDLADNASASEPNDLVQGFTTVQMYNVFSPNTHSFCEYRDRFIQTFPTVTKNQFNGEFVQNGFSNTCK